MVIANLMIAVKLVNLNHKHVIERFNWFEFNKLGLTLGMTLRFYSSEANALKLKVRKIRADSNISKNPW